MGAGEKHAKRHADYYRDAADILGMVELRRWALTARGRGFISTGKDTDEERAVLRGAIQDAEDLGEFRGALLANDEPDLPRLIAYARKQLPTLSHATVQRRVADTLSWRERVRARIDGARSPRRAATTERGQLDLLTRAEAIEPAAWPDPSRLPYNWEVDRRTVWQATFPDLTASDEVSLVMGYASLQELCHFVSMLEDDRPKAVRVVLGTEPFVGRARPETRSVRPLSQVVKDYWLERGFSVAHAVDVIERCLPT
jgi:hypothetical protein